MDLSLWLLPALLLLIALAAPRYGAGSRAGSLWTTHPGPPDPPPVRRRSTPAADLRALARLARRALARRRPVPVTGERSAAAR